MSLRIKEGNRSPDEKDSLIPFLTSGTGSISKALTRKFGTQDLRSGISPEEWSVLRQTATNPLLNRSGSFENSSVPSTPREETKETKTTSIKSPQPSRNIFSYLRKTDDKEKRGSIEEKEKKEDKRDDAVRRTVSGNIASPPRRDTAVSPPDHSEEGGNLIDELSYSTTNHKEMKAIKNRITKALKSRRPPKLFSMRDKAGQPILHVAVQKAHDLVPLLIEKGVDPNEKDRHGETALEIAGNQANESVFMQLLDAGALPTQKALIHFCANFCSTNCEQILKKLLETPGADTGINKFVRSGSPLHGAMMNKKENLVEGGCLCECPTLTVSGLIGTVLMTELLLSHGANPKIRNERGDSPLEWALYADNIQAARILLEHKAEIREITDMAKKAETERNSVARLLGIISEFRDNLVDVIPKDDLEYILGRLARCRVDEVGIVNLNKENLMAMGIRDGSHISAILSARKSFKSVQSGEDLGIKTRCDYYLVADYLDEPIQLWNNDVTLVGKKQVADLSESKDIVKDQLMFEVTGGVIVVHMGAVKIPAAIQQLQSGKAMVVMEGKKTYQVEEGDIIYLCEGNFPLTVIASTARAFEKRSYQPLSEWLPTVVDVHHQQPSSPLLSPRDGTEKVRNRRLDYRILQYRLEKIEILAGSEEQPTHENLFHILSNYVSDNVPDIRRKVCSWLKQNENREGELPEDKRIPSLVTSRSWETYAESFLPDQPQPAPGDGLCLLAAAEIYNCEFTIITSGPKREFVVKISPPGSGNGENLQKFLLGHLDKFDFVPLSQKAGETASVGAWNTTDLIDEREVIIEGLLGKGSSGHVYLAQWNGFRVATKQIHTLDKKKRDAFLKETLFLRKLRHPNIYLFMGTTIRDGELYIVTEYMEKGSLKQLLAKESKILTWEMIIRMSLDIAQGMNYLHSYKPMIIHRRGIDLKTGNILSDKDYNLKICDFGVAKFMQKENKVTRSYFSTVAWSSPELLENGAYTEKTDVYSFGLVLWSLLTGNEPWETKNEFQTIYAVMTLDERPQMPERVNAEFEALIRKCWSRKPLDRPSFTTIVETLNKIKSDPTDSKSKSDTLDNILLKAEECLQQNSIEKVSEKEESELQFRIIILWQHERDLVEAVKTTNDAKIISLLEAKAKEIRSATAVLFKLMRAPGEERDRASSSGGSSRDLNSNTDKVPVRRGNSADIQKESNNDQNFVKGSLPMTLKRNNSLTSLHREGEPGAVARRAVSTVISREQVDAALKSGVDDLKPSSVRSRSDSARSMTSSGYATPTGDASNELSEPETEDTKSERDPLEATLLVTDGEKVDEISAAVDASVVEKPIVHQDPVLPEAPPAPEVGLKTPDGLNIVWALDFNEIHFDKDKDEVGCGNSAVVYKAMYRGQRVAVKILQNDPDFADFKKEIDILSFVRSPDVCYFYGACVAPCYCIVSEFMAKGSLYDVMDDPKYKFTWKRVLRFATQAATSLNSLHNWKPTIVHRDIKSHNMLVDANSVLKIADLGLSRFTTFDNQDTLFRARGSLAYMAPEVWTSSTSRSGLGFTPKSDVYSYSIVLWEMMWRCYYGKWRLPFPNLFPFAIVTQVSKMNKRPDIDPNMPAPLLKLLQACWNADPEQRPTCGQIVSALECIIADYEQDDSGWTTAPPQPAPELKNSSSSRKLAEILPLDHRRLLMARIVLAPRHYEKDLEDGADETEALEFKMSNGQKGPIWHSSYKVVEILAIKDACKRGNIDILRLPLADPRVDPSAENNEAIRTEDNETIREASNAQVVELLLNDCRVDPNARNRAAWHKYPTAQKIKDDLREAVTLGCSDHLCLSLRKRVIPLSHAVLMASLFLTDGSTRESFAFAE
ncbi:hypothetical protein PROFUN_06668 [Planoprotostelium fungivorum]|uniref:Protein kinase domain-containing protein n=1 Tax=Planoprotostelium fungivorum TaxID=1890364 RepID=A0A2P6MT01_9EUKA|nr:hypothetical protein PROFUN_06668 [Planoprotostelium fungivorum]